jgi:indole-3-glycerol phosphate synthase
MDILSTICDYARERVKKRQEEIPLSEVKRQALSKKRGTYAFENALKGDGLSLICEVKKASPSKGIIDEQFDYLTIAHDYEAGGADCISCLTEPKWFLGSEQIFEEIRANVNIPMLRKDFILSEYQVYESKLLGAGAVLIIMSALEYGMAKDLFDVAEGLGMSALFECRNEGQIECAQSMGGRVIGVNNRNLSDFSVDLGRAGLFRNLVDRNNIFVSESGILSLDDVKAQKLIGADACLVGEFCMRAKDRRACVAAMKGV